MIGLFIDGKQVGTITMNDDLFAKSVARNKVVEFRDEERGAQIERVGAALRARMSWLDAKTAPEPVSA